MVIFAQGYQYFRPINHHDGSTLSVPSSTYVSHTIKKSRVIFYCIKRYPLQCPCIRILLLFFTLVKRVVRSQHDITNKNNTDIVVFRNIGKRFFFFFFIQLIFKVLRENEDRAYSETNGSWLPYKTYTNQTRFVPLSSISYFFRPRLNFIIQSLTSRSIFYVYSYDHQTEKIIDTAQLF